jgi:Mn-dependent DtxR family transcriptional regulator
LGEIYKFYIIELRRIPFDDSEYYISLIAEKLKISQPSVSARMHKLKQKGALAHVVGMNLTKVDLYMAKVDVTGSYNEKIWK